MNTRAWLTLILIAALVLPTVAAAYPPLQDEDAVVEAILEQMSPEDRVGQLFLVTFYGADVGEGSDIARLITEYRVGGVVLRANHDNFLPEGEGDLPAQVQGLTTALQTLAASGGEGDESTSPYVPLFIGIEHEGDNWPHTEILSGLTPLPSNMALGATWDPNCAEETGEVAGRELSALGINLLLGPSADVLGAPHPFTAGDLGTRSFGGEPFWVAEMTVAYVRGVHTGSDGRIAVVPKHFPGLGAADRLPSIEVPTVRRSLDQLTQVDLAPFFAVTGYAQDPLERADGLLTGHIRYLGFQGDNPRLPTRPISLDAQALGVLMTLDPVAVWREGGGLIISDALGLQGVRRFYDPQGTTFRNRRVAQDAFLAGNDILYLDEFGQNPVVDQTETIIDTIEFFVQTYNTDPAFQARVDEAVRRILQAKLRLYGRFELVSVLPSPDDLAFLGQEREVTFNTAQNALTLLSPIQIEQVTPPQYGEQIVIFTDTRTAQQCSVCPLRPLIDPTALQSAIVRLYGPRASGAVNEFDIRSYSFEQLGLYLATGSSGVETVEEGIEEESTVEGEGEPPTTPEPDPIATALNDADWIVFVMLDVTSDVPYSDTVRRFLADRPDIAARARVVVMAMSAPYYLDSTEIGKLDAYYALYGKTEPFVDVAARALFQGLQPRGAPPVSVSGLGYDIILATSPDPAQVISLEIEGEVPAEEGEEISEAATLTQGDTLQLRTGVIVDRNGHPVPDGTPVEFTLDYVNEGLRSTERVTTVEGMGRINLLLERPGELHISVSSEPALFSDVLQVFIPDAGAATISVEEPNIPPTPTRSPTQTPEPEPTPGIAPSPTPETASGLETPRESLVGFGDLFLTTLGLVALSGATFWYENVWRRRGLNNGLLMALPPIITGLVAYNFYAMDLPGAEAWRGVFRETWAAAMAAWIGGLVGLGTMVFVLYGGQLWHRQSR